MDGILVWGLALLFTVAVGLTGVYLWRNPEEPKIKLYVARGVVALMLSLCYWSQIIGLVDARTTVYRVRGIGWLSVIVAYIWPVVVSSRTKIIAEQMAEEVRRQITE